MEALATKMDLVGHISKDNFWWIEIGICLIASFLIVKILFKSKCQQAIIIKAEGEIAKLNQEIGILNEKSLEDHSKIESLKKGVNDLGNKSSLTEDKLLKENKILKDNLKALESKQELLDIEIERENGNLIIEKITRDFIYTKSEVQKMPKDQIKIFLQNNFKDFGKQLTKVMDIKWRMQRLNKDVLRDEIRELKFLGDKLKESEEIIKEEVKRRDISIFKSKVKAEDFVTPIFNNLEPHLHLYAFKENFRTYLKSLDFSFFEAAPILMKCLGGQPKLTILTEHGEHENDIERLFLTLENNFGDHCEIMERLKEKLQVISSIPSVVSRKWEEILQKSQEVKTILKALKQLQEVNPNIILYNKGLETVLKNIVPSEYYHLLCLKQDTNPDKILENSEAVININIKQAKNKVKLHQDVYPISLVTQQNHLRTKHGVYEVLNLPFENIYCNICEIFQSSKGSNNKNLHLVCKAKYAKFAVLESCVHLRDKTTTQRYQLIKQHQICAKCLLTNQHSTASCRYFSSKRYLKCSNAFCDLRYSLCSSHIEENKKKFQELNGISENFGIHVKT